MSPMAKANWAVLFFFLILLAQLLMPFGEPTVQATSPQDDWPMFRHDLAHTGVTSSAGPIESTELWRFAEGHFDGSFIGSSAAVVNGVVYVGSNYNQDGQGGGNVYALDAHTGNKIWNYSTNAPVYSSPAINKNMLIVGSADGNLYSLELLTGNKIWTFTTGNRMDSSPIVVEGVVYVGSWDSNVYALNASTGKKIWNYTTQDEISSSPAYEDGTVYIASTDGNIYAIDALTGIKKWNYSIGYSLSTPSIRDGVLYIGAGKSVLAINASSGDNIWTSLIFSEERSRGYSSPAIANGVLYIGSNGGGVYAFNASTGAQIWNNKSFSIVYSSPAVSNGIVYLNSAAINASTGVILENFSVGNTINASPTISNGVLYIASQDGNFYAIGRPLTAPLVSTQIALVVAGILTILVIMVFITMKRRKFNLNNKIDLANHEISDR